VNFPCFLTCGVTFLLEACELFLHRQIRNPCVMSCAGDAEVPRFCLACSVPSNFSGLQAAMYDSLYYVNSKTDAKSWEYKILM